MGFLTQCGALGYLNLILVIAGIIVVVTWGKKSGKPCAAACGFAAAVLSVGAMAFGLGMIKVASVVPGFEAAQRVDLLTIGIKEASGNLLLGGILALVLLIVGGVRALQNKPKQ